MIAVAMPRIIDEFDTSLETAGWLVAGYLIVLAALQPVTGKLGDRFGRRRLMLVGLVAFAAVSLGASLAPSLGVLIVFRLLQAVTIALTLPNYVAFLRGALSADRRAAGFGMLGAAIGIAAGFGPTIGGLMIAFADWRAVFYVNIPLVALALYMAWRMVPDGSAEPQQSPFDLFGSVLVSVVLVGAGLLILQGRQSLAAPAIALIAVALAALAALLIRRELAHPDPVINPRLFRNRAFTAATGGVSLSNLSFYTTLIALPIVLAANLDWSSARIGLALTLLSARRSCSLRLAAGWPTVWAGERRPSLGSRWPRRLSYRSQFSGRATSTPCLRASRWPGRASASRSRLIRRPPSNRCRPRRPVPPRASSRRVAISAASWARSCWPCCS